MNHETTKVRKHEKIRLSHSDFVFSHFRAFVIEFGSHNGTLEADDEVLAKRSDGVEEGVRLGGQIAFEDGLALGAQDVHEHGSGMQ